MRITILRINQIHNLLVARTTPVPSVEPPDPVAGETSRLGDLLVSVRDRVWLDRGPSPGAGQSLRLDVGAAGLDRDARHVLLDVPVVVRDAEPNGLVEVGGGGGRNVLLKYASISSG